MAVNNSLNLNGTGVVTSDGDGTYTYSTTTDGEVILGSSANSVTGTGVLSKGTVLVGDGAGVPTLLAVGTNDQVLTADSAEASGVKWADAGGGGGALSESYTKATLFTDFTGRIDGLDQQDSEWGWSVLRADTFGDRADSAHPGIATIRSTSVADSYLYSNQLTGTTYCTMATGGGAWSIRTLCRIDTLSSGGNLFKNRFGLDFDAYSAGDWTEGIQFTYTDTENSGNWRATTVSGGSSTHTDTGVAASTDWVWLRIDVNAAGTGVTFYIDDVSVATHSTNIPATGQFTIGAVQTRTAGASARYWDHDIWSAECTLTTSRAP